MSHRSPGTLASLVLFAALALPARAVVITEIPILSADAGAQYVTVAGDGSVYFTEYTKGRIGVIDRFGVRSEMTLPVGSKPMHIYTGAEMPCPARRSLMAARECSWEPTTSRWASTATSG
jgi:streptogramin lyase